MTTKIFRKQHKYEIKYQSGRSIQQTWNWWGEEPEEREVLHKLPSTRFNVHNEDDSKQAIEDSVKQTLLQIEKSQGTSSNLQFKKITSLTFHHDKYDPQGLVDTLINQDLSN